MIDNSTPTDNITAKPGLGIKAETIVAPVTIECWDPAKGGLQSVPLELDGNSRGRRRLRLPERVRYAAVGLHLGTRPLLLAIAADHQLEVELEIERISDKYRFKAGTLPIWYLPADLPRDRIAAPVHPSTANSRLDVALLIDGTMRQAHKENPLLLSHAPHRDALFQEILAAIEAAMGEEGYTDVRAAVAAFGDLPVTRLVQHFDLRPKYLIWPEAPERPRFEKLISIEALRDKVRAVPPSYGADQVDALGDGLRACSELDWRPGARRILVLAGDSPGFSLRHPPLAMTDLRAREIDVDLEADRLGAQGVEIVTVFSRLSFFRGDLPEGVRPFIEHARAQYARLASTPDYSFEVDWQAEKAAENSGVAGLQPMTGFRQDNLYTLMVQPDQDCWIGRGLGWAIMAE